MEGQRLDKWLYCARLAKTRTGAARLIEDGKVRVNGVRVLKPSRSVQPGDVVTATPPGCLRVVRVAALAMRRGPASLARTLYDDLTPQEPPASGPEQGAGQRKGGRPTKRDRRRIDAFRGGA
ncbi:MAG: RNA-binding S4 domain-containing protein [Methyloceanibacter sp.]